MSATSISIVTFKRSGVPYVLASSMISSIEHWGIFITYHDNEGRESKVLYHADKISMINNTTKHMVKEWPIDLNDIKYLKVSKILLVGYASQGSYKLTQDMMNNYCDEIDEDRTFNTITNNCQAWVQSVLNKLIHKKHISQLAFDEFKRDNKITPLLGWTRSTRSTRS
jgi:hypothetical protein